MNAIQFIKLYGLHSARVIVEDAQENTHYCTETGYHSIELDVNYEPCPDCVSIPELKRLVESVDRIDHFVDINEMVDANAGVTVITPKGTSKVKGGMTAFVDMAMTRTLRIMLVCFAKWG